MTKTADIIKEQMEKEVDVIQFENRYQTKDGDYRWFEWAANPVPEEGITYSAAYDITDRKRAEKALQDNEKFLQQAQKMESIGTLAGGIAHDFNNILFPIVGCTEMLLEDIPEDNHLRDNLNEVYNGAMRATELVKQILTFSRQDNHEVKLMRMQPVIKEALKL